MSKRLVILVPTKEDGDSKEFRRTYWPNFVDAVIMALKKEQIDCEVRVVPHANGK